MLDTSALTDIFREYPYIAAAYLFGSHAKGTAGPMSDVDIALLLNDDAPRGIELIHEEGRIADRIQRILGLKAEVDVIALNGKNLVFQHNVLRTGKLIYESDKDIRVRFTARVISEFCDFEPRLRYMEKFQFAGWRRRLAKI